MGLLQVRRESTLWENILANDTLDKSLISKIHKQLISVNTRKTNNPIKKWAKDLNRHFSKDIQRAHTHMKKVFNITSHQRGMHIKTTMRYHFIQVGMTIINKSTNSRW